MSRLATAAGPAALLCLAFLASPPAHAGPGNGTLIVLNKAEATASLIDLASGEVAATLPTGEGPHEVAVAPNGRLAAVANYGTREAAGSTLTLISLPGAEVVRTIDLGEYRRPHGVEFLPGGRELAVTAEEQKALIIVEVESGEVTRAIETDQQISHMVSLTPDGKRAFVANIVSGSVTAIDLKNARRLANIPTGEGAEGIAVTPDGKEVWVTNRGADTVTVLDAGTLELIKEIPCASFPIRAKVTPDGRHILVSNARSGDLAVFNAATKEELHRIPMELTAEITEGRLFGGRFGDSSVPIGILIQPDGRLAYVANANADVISIVDLSEWKTDGYLTAGREPDGLGYSPHVVKASARGKSDSENKADTEKGTGQERGKER
jgi:YVTN family beta-propeller protein